MQWITKTNLKWKTLNLGSDLHGSTLHGPTDSAWISIVKIKIDG